MSLRRTKAFYKFGIFQSQDSNIAKCAFCGEKSGRERILLSSLELEANIFAFSNKDEKNLWTFMMEGTNTEKTFGR